MSELKPIIMNGGWCDPSCPFLKEDYNDSEFNICEKLNVVLDWYDYHLAACQHDEHKEPKQ